MKTEKERYLAPEVESLHLMGAQQVLAGSDTLDSTIESMDILGDDLVNWGGLI